MNIIRYRSSLNNFSPAQEGQGDCEDQLSSLIADTNRLRDGLSASAERITKSSMWNTSCPSVNNTINAFEQKRHIELLRVSIESSIFTISTLIANYIPLPLDSG